MLPTSTSPLNVVERKRNSKYDWKNERKTVQSEGSTAAELCPPRAERARSRQKKTRHIQKVPDKSGCHGCVDVSNNAPGRAVSERWLAFQRFAPSLESTQLASHLVVVSGAASRKGCSAAFLRKLIDTSLLS